MNFSIPSSKKTLLTIVCTIFYFLKVSKADQRELYNTKLATSDLQWETFSSTSVGGWEEVSSFNDDYQSTIRSYQVCDEDKTNSNNWVRSPFIPALGGKQIHLDIEYSISRCDSNPDETSSKCKETFNIFYYKAESNVASSTFPPWHENPYMKIDTVAANEANEVNSKTFPFGPLDRNGFYVAVQDQGSCMSLISLRVYYYYCPETTVDLVLYPFTISEVGAASLVTVKGSCVSNAMQAQSEDPQYRCSSNGHWQISTGRCYCEPGYEKSSRNTVCSPCPRGMYKLASGPEACIRCPKNSGHPESLTLTVTKDTKLTNQCPCHNGYARAPNEAISVPCSKPPSHPTALNATDVNATSALLHWEAPTDIGGRDSVFYRFKCQSSDIDVITWSDCPASVLYLAPSSDGKYFEKSLRIANLLAYQFYKITVVAENDASISMPLRDVTNSASTVEFKTHEAVPSAVSGTRHKDRSNNFIALIWNTPLHPNGQILGYEIESQIRVSGSGPTSQPPKIHKATANKITLNGLKEDTEYEIRVRARTSVGYGPYSAPYKVKTISSASLDNQKGTPETQDTNNNLILIIAGIGGGLLFILIVITIIRYYRSQKLLCLDLSNRRRKSQQMPLQNGNSHHDTALQQPLIVDLPPLGQRTYVDYPDPAAAVDELGKEVDPHVIKIEEVIGEGEFAEVCRGKIFLQDQFLDVAVKRLKSGATERDHLNFLREASTMAQFIHPNVIELQGAVTKSNPAMIVTEYMENGSLDHYLKTNKGRLSVLQMVKMLQGIASGMNYLSNRKYVHRDLAARNILVDSELVCKVSDFGLSRTLENNPHATYTTQGGKIAIRWTAPESIMLRKFTSSSDVWSYGIVAWEVMSYGEKPYWDMSNDEVIKNIQQGMRLPSPVDCPKILHKMMVRCWAVDPSYRPNFSELVQEYDVIFQKPSLLKDDITHSQLFTAQETTAASISSPNLARAVASGEVTSVQQWLKIQRLNEYADRFHRQKIDDLEKVSNLTINDLQALGIEVRLQASTLNGIQTLKRHLSTCTSTPPSSRASTISTVQEEDRGLVMEAEVQDDLFG